MKMNEAARIARLTRKAIHFYIREELLQPETNADNGYYEFNAQDIRTLQNIALLRQFGMLMTEVKNMLDNPQMSRYFLHNLLENLYPELYDLTQKVQKLAYLLSTLPPKADVDFLRTNSLSGRLNFEDRIERIYDLYFHDENVVILSILIWGSFLDVSTTEYHSYLQGRLMDMTRSGIDDPLHQTYHYLMALNWEATSRESIRRYFITMRAVESAPAGMEVYHRKCLELLRALSRSRELMARWKQVYHSVLLSLMKFCKNVSDFISKYSPSCTPYVQNDRQCCHLLIQDLKKAEIRLLRGLEDGLDGMLDLSGNDGCVLAATYTYTQSAFSILPQARVRELSEET